MKISFVKQKQDKDTYKIPKGLGMDIFEIDNPNQIDSKIEELKQQNYTTICIPNYLASFSENIIKKYQRDTNFKIIITPQKIIR